MKTYDFYLDEKVTCWYRTMIQVEAESEEQAKGIALKRIEEEDDIYSYGWEQIDDTIEMMTVDENDNNPTKELYIIKHQTITNSDEEFVWCNKKSEDE
jgi:hypothetical protein